MRNRQLHDALRAFAAEAADRLAGDAAEEEVPFDVVEAPGPGPTLYCYRPLTAAFIGERAGILTELPSYPGAARALEATNRADAYLIRRGEPRIPEHPRERADLALSCLLERCFADAPDFSWSPQRFARAYQELEDAITSGRTVTTVVAPLPGVELESDEVALGEGLTLAWGDVVPDAPREAVWPAPRTDERPTVLAVLTVEHGEDSEPAPAPLAAARVRLRRLLTALRLFEDGAFGLGPAGWMRADRGAWQLVRVHGGSRAAGPPLRILAADEDELRAFVSLISRRAPAAGEVAWALARFEMGHERIAPFEGLTDHLLALRALLEPEGPASGRLPQRLAAICALPADRPALAQRTARAIALERAVIGGLEVSEPRADELAAEIGRHLRALLRDVICGHLDSDLVSVADGLLEAAAEAPGPETVPANGADASSEPAGPTPPRPPSAAPVPPPSRTGSG